MRELRRPNKYCERELAHQKVSRAEPDLFSCVLTVRVHIGRYLFVRQRVSFSYVHVHSLQSPSRAITAVVLIMTRLLLRVEVRTGHASAGRASRTSAVAARGARR